MSEWYYSSLKEIAFRASNTEIMPNLQLQKPSQYSQSKNHLSALERRMELWESREIMGSVKPGKVIQCLKTTNTTSTIKKYKRNSLKFT